MEIPHSARLGPLEGGCLMCGTLKDLPFNFHGELDSDAKHGLSMGAGRRTRRPLASVWSPTIPAMIALMADAPALHMPEKVVSRTLNSRAGARAGGKATWTHGGEERTAYGHRMCAVDQPSYKHGCKSEGLPHFMRLGWESHDCHGVHGMSVCRRTSSASGVAARPSGVRTTKA